MLSQSCFATLMRSFKSLKQAFYQHENNSTSSDGLMDACFLLCGLTQVVEENGLENRQVGKLDARVRISETAPVLLPEGLYYTGSLPPAKRQVLCAYSLIA